jgi:hypothetical protein
MDQTIPQNLKYGIIYLYSDRTFSQGLHDAETIVEKFVYPMKIEWVDQPGRPDLFLVARRFNVGNIGKYATVSLTLSRLNRSGGWFEAIRRFADELMGVTDVGDGDIVIDEADFGYRYDMQSSIFDSVSEAAPQDKTQVNQSKKPGIFGKLLRKNKDSHPRPKVQEDTLEHDDRRELAAIERERKQALERIRHEIVNYIAQYHDDPKDLMAELLRGKIVVGSPGHLLVNGDMKIVLPEYDEMEIKMPALCRTLYILFMKHRVMGQGGFELKNIDLYRDEIVDIYSLVKPGADEERVRRTVDNLCDPFSNALNETISRANGFIKKCIVDKNLQKQYLISGVRGEEYSIGLDPGMMTVPRAILQEGIA